MKLAKIKERWKSLKEPKINNLIRYSFLRFKVLCSGDYQYFDKKLGISYFLYRDSFQLWSNSFFQTEPLLKAFLSLMKDNEQCLFIDIGANQGLYSLAISQRNIDTIAFEPVPETLNKLYKNLSLIPYPKVSVINHPLSNHKKIVSMTTHDKGSNRIVEPNLNNDYKLINTLTLRGEDIISLIDIEKKYSKVFIKIDVERHELSVLEGFGESLQKIPELIVSVEYFSQENAFALYEKLSSIGLIPLNGNTLLPSTKFAVEECSIDGSNLIFSNAKCFDLKP